MSFDGRRINCLTLFLAYDALPELVPLGPFGARVGLNAASSLAFLVTDAVAVCGERGLVSRDEEHCSLVRI